MAVHITRGIHIRGWCADAHHPRAVSESSVAEGSAAERLVAERPAWSAAHGENLAKGETERGGEGEDADDGVIASTPIVPSAMLETADDRTLGIIRPPWRPNHGNQSEMMGSSHHVPTLHSANRTILLQVSLQVGSGMPRMGIESRGARWARFLVNYPLESNEEYACDGYAGIRPYEYYE